MPQHLNKSDAASSCAEGNGKRTGDELNDQHCANQQAPAGTSLQGKCLSIPLHPLFRPTKRNRRNRPGRFCEASSPDPKVQNPTTLAEAQHGTQVIYGAPIYLEKKYQVLRNQEPITKGNASNPMFIDYVELLSEGMIPDIIFQPVMCV